MQKVNHISRRKLKVSVISDLHPGTYGCKICYLNSGDWVGNMTALEYNEGTWHLKFWEPHWSEKNEPAIEETFSRPSRAVFIRAFEEVMSS